MGSISKATVPMLAALFYLALIMPPEFSVTVAGLRLSLYRVLLLVMTIPLLVRLVQNTRQPPHIVDYLIMAHAFWVVLALTVYGGIAAGIESGGIYVVESLGAYLLGRLTITSAAEHRALLYFMVSVLGVMFMITLPESLTGTHFIREAARAVMGGPGLPVIEARMGLDRAFGSFDHPILYGVFAASTFAATYYVLSAEKLNTRALGLMGVVAGSTFLSLSAGPFVGLACQCCVIGWDKVTKGISLRWSVLMGIFLLMWFAVSLASNRSPIKVFISYLTFSAHSAYNRILIWEYGSAEVGRNPLFGIGFGDWIRAPWMSDSMDNFWLLTAVRYGLPALVFLVAAIVILAIRQAKMNARHRDLNRHRMAWLAIIIGLSVSGITVHFWNALFAYFFFLVGTGAWLVHPQRRSDPIPMAALYNMFGLKQRTAVAY
ncbi:MAG: hypothetical protein ABJK25_08685 [Halieaceae bacterium]